MAGAATQRCSQEANASRSKRITPPKFHRKNVVIKFPDASRKPPTPQPSTAPQGGPTDTRGRRWSYQVPRPSTAVPTGARVVTGRPMAKSGGRCKPVDGAQCATPPEGNSFSPSHRKRAGHPRQWRWSARVLHRPRHRGTQAGRLAQRQVRRGSRGIHGRPEPTPINGVAGQG